MNVHVRYRTDRPRKRLLYWSVQQQWIGIAINDIGSRLAGATILAAALVVSPASLAQAPASQAAPRTGPASEASPMFQRHHAMAGIMKDMVQEMNRMHADMGKGEMTPEARKQMAAKMKRMSEMMRRMSGWADRPTMKEPEMRRQFEEMRKQMGEMSKPNSMGDPGRSK